MKKNILLSFGFLLLLSGANPIHRDDTYHLTGIVTDAQTSTPIANARISVLFANTNQAIIPYIYTDATGFFDTSDFIAINAEEQPLVSTNGYFLGNASPNPVSNDRIVTIPYGAPTARMKNPTLLLFDALGRKVSARDELAPGVYFYRLRFENGYLTSGLSLVVNAHLRPQFVLKPVGPEKNAGKMSVLSAEADIVVEKVGYAPQTIRVQMTAGSTNTVNVALDTSSTFNLMTEDLTIEAQVTVPAAGGTISIDNTNSPLNGMSLDVPDGSYPEARDFTISYAPLIEYNFGPNFNPIGPMIQISNGGSYADSLMVLTLPAQIPPGDFAMAFLYNENTGTLEGLPLTTESDSSITVMTRHFFNPTGPQTTGKGGASSVSNVLITSVRESVLNFQTIVDTGFKPGTDDWEFANYGSFISPGGHCAGQSIGAMWYYYEHRLNGEPGLNGLFDTVKSLQYDDPLGYRFSSVIQEDTEWDGRLAVALNKFQNEASNSRLQWYAFIYSILLTGEPQLVVMYRPNGGHAIVAYKVSVSEGKLYVADPNYPAQVRSIEFRNDKLQPYNTKQNANEQDDNPYSSIGYFAKTAVVDWDKIGRRWLEVGSKTIGNNPPNAFPSYTLERWTPSGYQVIPDSFEVSTDTITVLAACPTCPWKWNVGSIRAIKSYEFDASGILKGQSHNGLLKMQLVPGSNNTGVYIDAKVEDRITHPYFEYIDFKWLNIHYTGPIQIIPSGPAGAPITIPGVAETDYKFTAKLSTPRPTNSRYEWQFGDESDDVTILQDSTVQHVFSAAGSYLLRVSIFDDDTDDLVAHDSASVTILSAETIVIPFNKTMDNSGVYAWAPYTATVAGLWTLSGAGAWVDYGDSDYYSLRVLKDQEATLSLDISTLLPTDPMVVDTTDENGKRTVDTYSPPYLAKDMVFDNTGAFPQSADVSDTGATLTFTITAWDGQYVSANVEICSDWRSQWYDKDGILYYDYTQSAGCFYAGPSLFIEAGIPGKGNPLPGMEGKAPPGDKPVRSPSRRVWHRRPNKEPR